MSMNAAALASNAGGWATSTAAPLKARRAVKSRAAARTLPQAARADAKIIDGKAIAADVREEVRVKVAAMKEKHGKVPGKCASRHTRPTESGGGAGSTPPRVHIALMKNKKQGRQLIQKPPTPTIFLVNEASLTRCDARMYGDPQH